MRQLLDIVYQAVELPLRIHFLLPSEREAVELFVVPDVAKLKLQLPLQVYGKKTRAGVDVDL